MQVSHPSHTIILVQANQSLPFRFDAEQPARKLQPTLLKC